MRKLTARHKLGLIFQGTGFVVWTASIVLSAMHKITTDHAMAGTWVAFGLFVCALITNWRAIVWGPSKAD